MAQGRNAEPTAAILDSRTLQSTPESGARAGYDGAKRKKGSKVHVAVDTLGHLLAVHVTPATPANEQDRAQVQQLAQAVQEVTGHKVQEVTGHKVQEVTGHKVQVAFVDAGYTGEQASEAAEGEGMRLEVVKLPDAKGGFVLLPRRWV